ncbi:MAG TPA: CAP domain-containing protein, partial [Nocardioidaceae bacterium]|nr:CAP domain-containing protein [Nocardioidaceae bacterium]
AMYAGETLGRGAISPRRLVRMWMHSDGHRHVLLSRKSRRIGIGAVPDAYGRWVVAANFMRF